MPSSLFLIGAMLLSAYDTNAYNRTTLSMVIMSIVAVCIVICAYPSIDSVTQAYTYKGIEYVAQEAGYTDYLYLYNESDLWDIVDRGDQITCDGGQINCTEYKHEGVRVSADLQVYGNSCNDVYIELPIYWYPGYISTIDGKKVSNTLGNSNLVSIDFSEYTDDAIHRLEVAYSEPIIWRVAELISLVSVGIFIAISIGVYINNKTNCVYGENDY